MDLEGHCLDLLEMFFGPVSAVSCLTGHTVQRYATEDSAALLARFKNETLATVDTFFCIRDHSSKNRLELYGSNGSILAQSTLSQSAAGEMIAFLENAGKYDAKQVRNSGESLNIAPPPV